jgi:hypothetical protein
MSGAILKKCVEISRCVKCDEAIPTLLVGDDPACREWACRQCGATYYACLVPGSAPYLRDRLRLVHYFPKRVQEIPDISQHEPGIELRRHRRRSVTMRIPLTQLDHELMPVGEDFEVLSSDLSESGIALLHTEPLRGKLAALIVLPDYQYVQLILRIVRCQPRGSLYEMGAKFLQRLDP